MKKLFSFVAMALLSATTFAATQYCQEPLVATDGTALLSLKHSSGNAYEVELVAQGGMKFTKAYNINCGVNQTGGAGIFFANEKWVISADGLTATCAFETASETSVPTNFYATGMCFAKQGGTTTRDLVEFNLEAITDIDWTATCAAGPVDEVAPVMGAASLESVTYNSAVINVAGTDKETEDGAEVAVTRFKVLYGETSKTYTAKDGQITITGLTPGKTYSFTIYAVDAAGNVSDNFATVEATTESLTYCDFATGHLGDANFGDANGRILLTLKLTAANKVQITVKPNTENGATKLLDYLYVVPSGAKAPTYTAGAHIAEGGETSMSVEVEYEALPATMNFHLEWSHPAWDGNWAMDVNGVTAEMLCTEPEKPTAIDEIGQTISITKTIENGQIMIIRDGVKYNVVGNVIEK